MELMIEFQDVQSSDQIDERFTKLKTRYNAKILNRYKHTFPGGAIHIPSSKLDGVLAHEDLKVVSMNRILKRSGSSSSETDEKSTTEESKTAVKQTKSLNRIKTRTVSPDPHQSPDVYVAVLDNGIKVQTGFFGDSVKERRYLVDRAANREATKKLMEQYRKEQRKEQKQEKEEASTSESVNASSSNDNTSQPNREKETSNTDPIDEEQLGQELTTPYDQDFFGWFISESSHGTAVAGTIAGLQQKQSDQKDTKNRQKLQIGVLPNKAGLIDVRIADNNGSARLSDIIGGINAVLEMKKKKSSDNGPVFLMNLSYTTSFMKNQRRLSLLHKAIRYAKDRDILTIVPSGNDGKTIANDSGVIIPSIYSETLTVGAINQRNDKLYEGTNIGKQLDLVAPGVDVKTINRKGEITRRTGTSYASGYASGAAARLVLQAMEQDAHAQWHKKYNDSHKTVTDNPSNIFGEHNQDQGRQNDFDSTYTMQQHAVYDPLNPLNMLMNDHSSTPKPKPDPKPSRKKDRQKHSKTSPEKDMAVQNHNQKQAETFWPRLITSMMKKQGIDAPENGWEVDGRNTSVKLVNASPELKKVPEKLPHLTAQSNVNQNADKQSVQNDNHLSTAGTSSGESDSGGFLSNLGGFTVTSAIVLIFTMALFI